MDDKFNLQRFLDAQANTYERALEELRNGRKQSHWMWFIFPQFRGLGRSSTSIKYAINYRDEASAYLNHPILGSRLKEITETFLIIENKSASDILGHPDDIKIKSSMTLFEEIQDINDLFGSVLEKYFDGSRCARTKKLLKIT